MRLHRLTAQAFGPFTDEVEVDFDALSDHGLFLLSGPTGAGKSSVLDAVCFALYGAVPGRRNTARALRSDRAPADRVPRVELEVGIGGRRFRFVRSPAWERPKKRGEGTTTEQARVSVTERVGEQWRSLATRADEAGDLVVRLLGMSCHQFCCVAMLPQGEFATFLQATSDERQVVLQRLFRTDRYVRVEDWLAEHRRATRRRADAALAEVRDGAGRLAEVAGLQVPAAVLVDDPLDGLDAGDEPVHDWSEAVVVGAAADHAAAQEAATTCDAADREARAHLDEVTARAAARRRHDDAVARRTTLEADAGQVATLTARVEAAGRAAAVVGLLDAADRAEAAAERAEAQWSAAAAPWPDDLEATLEVVRERRGALRAAVPRADDLHRRRDRLAGLETDLAAAREQADRAAAQEAELPAHLEQLRDALARLEREAAELDVRARRVQERRDGRASARELAELAPALRESQESLESARATRNDLKEHWLALVEARVSGMAGELAAALAVGEDCPVCGSSDHPRPAAGVGDQPGRAQEQAARVALDDAEIDLSAREEALRGLETREAGARARAAGLAEGEWCELLDDAVAALAEAERAVAEAPKGRVALEQAQAQLDLAADDRESAGLRVAGLVSQVATLGAEVGAIADDLQALLDAEQATDLAEALRRLESTESALRAAVAASAAHERAGAAAATATADARAAALTHGFDDLAGVREARLDDAERERLTRRSAEHHAELAALTAALADPEVAAAGDGPVPDVDAATATARAAESAARAAGDALAVASRREADVRRLAALLTDRLAALVPVRDELARASALADLAAGRGAANRRRLSLGAYVLAWRLSQVVAAANTRLASMTGRRYTLEHATATAPGQRRSGLDLLVRDEWSGHSRVPATLSGGETFVVSLALALGLSDVVTGEAEAEHQGADIDTLFVDEGFGSLDADTLDDVLDVLDGLREGGRVVGVVSHVAGMRQRMPAVLEVLAAPAGSRVRMVGGAA